MKIHKKKTNWAPFWTLLPVTVWVAVFITVPMLLVLLVSFMKRGTWGGLVYEFNINNYCRFIEPLYLHVVFNSLVVAFATTLVCILVGYPFAYAVARSPKSWRNILLMLIIIPFWSSSLIRTYSWVVLLRTEGVINNVLLSLGIIHEPLAMLYNLGAVTVGMAYTLFPFMVLPLYASIEKVDHTLLEAASDLGAGPWQAFRRVTLPLTMPGITAGSLLVFIPTLGLFFISDLMGGSRTMMISNLIKNQFLDARNWPFGSAASVILIILTLVFIWLYLRTAGSKDQLEVF
ncbi:spermidine/putrescine transport system permease protein [Desulfotomaculum arcticum]|uniref:Spermidine/putrescine transport system permease protein n=1 Tax=Desulfotruncus arcticus DSM 17038 TaxID=1121424 RepID=A0A1I2QN12_9FIRM|nr:ABC transporter permease [Desulfotruncus arcticus]SFG28709.1 spermidine/putrescine transport system permease protein [Desulfotomaculum arcticum] [Desulfotruncus arcticus DSM 17038]